MRTIIRERGLLQKTFVLSFTLTLPFSGVCEENTVDWNYYLVSQDGELYYDGYKNAKFSRNGEIWQTSYPLPSKMNQELMMNISENNMKEYPTGHFWGHLKYG